MEAIKVQCRFHPEAQLIDDFRSGDQICRECGLVVGASAVDLGSEWRTFISNRCPEAPSRVGGAENPYLMGSNLATTTLSNSSDLSAILSDYLQPKKNRSEQTADRLLLHAFKEITDLADRMCLPKSLVERAKNMFHDVHEKPLLKPRSKDATAVACLYASCRLENIPRTYREVCGATRIAKKEIGRCYKLILRSLDTPIPAITVKDYMSRFCINLQLPREIQNAATEIAQRAVELDLVPGKSPIAVSAAAIYMASQASNTRKSSKEISQVAGLSDATIRQAYKMMILKAEQLFPKSFTFVTPIEELPLT